MYRTSSQGSPCVKMLAPRSYSTMVFAIPAESRNACALNGGRARAAPPAGFLAVMPQSMACGRPADCTQVNSRRSCLPYRYCRSPRRSVLHTSLALLGLQLPPLGTSHTLRELIHILLVAAMSASRFHDVTATPTTYHHRADFVGLNIAAAFQSDRHSSPQRAIRLRRSAKNPDMNKSAAKPIMAHSESVGTA